MSYKFRNSPFSITTLAFAIAAANSSYIQADGSRELNTSDIEFTDNASSIDISDKGQNVNLEWNKFNILESETFEFIQAENGVVVNEIFGDTSGSQIMGTIKANGHVFLVNENGFTFGKNAVIDTQGFLATSFETSITTDDNNEMTGFSLTGNGAGSITVDNLDIKNNTQYAAFYSQGISVNGDITDNTAGNNTHILLNTQQAKGEITLPGLPIGFSASSDILNHEQFLTFKDVIDQDGGPGRIESVNGSIILNSKNLADLFTGNINLPDTISVKSIEMSSNDDIDISNSIIASSSGNVIKELSIETTQDITINKFILSDELSLKLKSDILTISDSGTNKNYIGGGSGLKDIDLEANTITISEDLKSSESINLNGSVVIHNESKDNQTVSFQANKITIKNIDINDENSESYKNNIVISANEVNIGNIGSLDNLTKFDDINILADSVGLGGSYFFNDNFTIKSDNQDFTSIKLNDSINFYGDSIFLDTPIFQNTSGKDITINAGSSDHRISSIKIDNMDITEESNALSHFSIYAKDKPDISLGGELRVQSFLIDTIFHEDNAINITSDLSISSLNTIDILNADIKAANLYDISFTGTGNNQTTASINNIFAKDINLSNFERVETKGTQLNSSNNINIDSTKIILKDDLYLESQNGAVTISGTINAEQNSIDINSGFGGFSINSITNADSITLSNNPLTDQNVEHILSGSYDATNFIDAQNLGSVTVNGDELSLTAGNSINLKGSQLSGANADIELHSDTITADSIKSSNITIDNNSIKASQINLNGDLIANDNIVLHTESINLESDLLISGNIDFLKSKTFTDPANKTGLVYTDTVITPPSINGNHHLTLNATNSDAYLYDFGSKTPLASLTLNGEGTLHMINDPIISSSRGLSILGDWDWTLDGSKVFSYENQDLNLSGVNLNTVGTLTFNTGTGNLSLGNIGSNGLITDIIFEETGTLNLHGDINLVGTTFGYDFSNVNAINLYKDMTFGSANEATIVNFGNATVDGTFNLSIYGSTVTLGKIGSNIALQDLSITTTDNLNLDDSINLVGKADIQAQNINVNGSITSTGSDINLNAISDISMLNTSTIHSDFGNIRLESQNGNIQLGSLNAKGEVYIQSHTGGIYNAINDYVSNDQTSINVTANNLTLLGLSNIGQSVASPIVININNDGVINTGSNGNIFIANLANAGINSESRVTDITSKSDTAIIDAYNLFQLSSINALIEPTYQTTLGLIENSSWQSDEEERIKTIKTPNASPNLYYSRQGWRLGY